MQNIETTHQLYNENVIKTIFYSENLKIYIYIKKRIIVWSVKICHRHIIPVQMSKLKWVIDKVAEVMISFAYHMAPSSGQQDSLLRVVDRLYCIVTLTRKDLHLWIYCYL